MSLYLTNALSCPISSPYYIIELLAYALLVSDAPNARDVYKMLYDAFRLKDDKLIRVLILL